MRYHLREHLAAPPKELYDPSDANNSNAGDLGDSHDSIMNKEAAFHFNPHPSR